MSCDTCEGERTHCLSCRENWEFVPEDSVCLEIITCNEDEILNEDKRQCERCHENCRTCDGKVEHCVSCREGMKLLDDSTCEDIECEDG